MLLSLPASRSWDPPDLTSSLDLFKRINRPSLTTGHPLLRHDWHPIEKDAGVFVLSCYLKTNRQCHLSHALWRQIYYHVHTLLLWIVKLISQCQHLPRFAFSPVGKLGNLWTLFSHFCPSLWEFLFYIESWHLAEVERGERRKDNYMKLYFIFWGVQRYYEGVILYKGWRMIPTFQSSNNLRKHWKTRRSNKLCNNTKSGHWYTLLGWHLHNTNKF